MTVQGERKREEEEERTSYHRYEKSYGKFSRSLFLPQNALVDRIQAKMENGVLEVHVPKAVEREDASKKVDIA